MSVFNYFTKEQRERARNTDLVQLLRSRGEKLKRSGSERGTLTLCSFSEARAKNSSGRVRNLNGGTDPRK